MEKTGFTIRCGGHTYITLEYDGKFIFCLDNDMMYAEEMIWRIEKRTRMNFQDIPIMNKPRRSSKLNEHLMKETKIL